MQFHPSGGLLHQPSPQTTENPLTKRVFDYSGFGCWRRSSPFNIRSSIRHSKDCGSEEEALDIGLAPVFDIFCKTFELYHMAPMGGRDSQYPRKQLLMTSRTMGAPKLPLPGTDTPSPMTSNIRRSTQTPLADGLVSS